MNLSILRVLNEKAPYSVEELSCSTYDTIRDRIVTKYKELTGEEVADETTSLAEVDDSVLKSLYEFIQGAYGVTYDENQDGRPETLGELINYVVANQGESVDDRLKHHHWDSKAFKEASDRLESIAQMIEGINHSEEGLGNGLLKIFIGVADLFIRVGNTFKTNIFKFFKTFKRSEIRYYSESNVLKIKQVEGLNYTTIMNTEVPVVTGVLVGYKPAIEYVNQVYNAIDIRSYAETLYNELVDIRRQMTRGEDAYKKGFNKTAIAVNTKFELLRRTVAYQTKIFSDKQTPVQMPFKTAYGSVQNMKDARAKLMDMEKYLGETAALVDLVDKIDVILGDITGYLTEDSEVDKQFVTQLSNTVRFLATGFDTFGQNAMRQMALEHNMILCYEQLYKNI